ncbi:MAG: SCP2 sterol-binding domain-containing protein [Promethearchaeota archaeon]
MEELRKLIEGLADADEEGVIRDIPLIMDKIKEVGFLKVVQDEDLRDFLPEMREKMGDIDPEKLVPLAEVVMPTLFDGLGELIEASEEAKEELEDMEDMTVQISVPDLDIYLFVKLEDGKFSAGNGKLDNAELRLSMDKATFIEQMKGEGDLVSSYMSGAVTLEGPLNKAMAMNTLFEVISDEYEIDLGIG